MFGWRKLFKRVAPEGSYLFSWSEVIGVLGLQTFSNHGLGCVILPVALVVRDAHHVIELVLKETFLLLLIEQILDALYWVIVVLCVF